MNTVPARHRAWRLVVLEVAVVAVALAALSGSTVGVAAAGAAAVVVVALAYLRSNGRWWTENVRARWRWRRRRAAGSAIQTHTIEGYDDRGTAVGIGCDAGGWYAALAVAPSRGVTGSRGVDVPVGKLAELLGDRGLPLSAVQVVSWATPSPHHLLPQQVPSVASYQQLAADLVATGPAPIEQRDFVAVRLDVLDAAPAAHRRGGGIDGVHRAVAASLARVGKALNGAGVATEILGPRQLAEAVRLCAGLESGATTPIAANPSPGPVEDWTLWQLGGLHHLAYEVSGLPERGAPLSALLRTPAAQVVISIELRAEHPHTDTGDGNLPAATAFAANGAVGVAARAVVRVAAPPHQVAVATRAFLARAGQLGFKVRSLDGWQGPAAYASAPTGGGPW